MHKFVLSDCVTHLSQETNAKENASRHNVNIRSLPADVIRNYETAAFVALLSHSLWPAQVQSLVQLSPVRHCFLVTLSLSVIQVSTSVHRSTFYR
jgi:hypothetical protein